MTDAVLATIDGAIEDWETGDDAMRHVPQQQRRFKPPIVMTADNSAMVLLQAQHCRICARWDRQIDNGPPPLWVDGREYHRRQQARRKKQR